MKQLSYEPNSGFEHKQHRMRHLLLKSKCVMVNVCNELRIH